MKAELSATSWTILKGELLPTHFSDRILPGFLPLLFLQYLMIVSLWHSEFSFQYKFHEIEGKHLFLPMVLLPRSYTVWCPVIQWQNKEENKWRKERMMKGRKREGRKERNRNRNNKESKRKFWIERDETGSSLRSAITTFSSFVIF